MEAGIADYLWSIKEIIYYSASMEQLIRLDREEKTLNMNVKVGTHGDVTAKFVTADA
jgi:hypothetical protein